MTAWTALLAALAAHPASSLALAACMTAGAWGLHIARLRRREQHLLALVDERTRLWQSEVAARADLDRRLEALASEDAPEPATPPPAVAHVSDGHAAADAAVGSGGDRPTRVLVVDERRERRDAVIAAFDGLGIHPVFADSRWAATVATSEAEAEGDPYDLILIDAAMEGAGEPAGAL